MKISISMEMEKSTQRVRSSKQKTALKIKIHIKVWNQIFKKKKTWIEILLSISLLNAYY